ncbi:MAG: Ig-like domain-containing protein [Verrucomicrobia bacterium]|nr:Ig-like domain-containing protein [Verrucomicrobiota bacterium]
MMLSLWITNMRSVISRAEFWLALALAGLLGPSSFGYPSAIYTYVDNGSDGTKHTYQLMLPTDIPVIRGLLIEDDGRDSRDDYKRTVFNEFLHLHGFGYVGGSANSTPGLDEDRHNGLANAFMRGLTNFAGQSGHKELVNVPFVFYGFSSQASHNWLLTLNQPSRTIAACPLHGGSPSTNGLIPYSKAIGVPVAIITGDNDSPSTPTSLFTFPLYRPLGALWSLSVLQGVGHVEVNQSALGIPFLDRMIRLRYPPDQNPLNGPINLLPVVEESGWLADNSTWKSGFTYVTNYANFTGDRRTASWLPDAGIANLYRALTSYNKTIKITAVAGQAVVPTAPVVLNPQSDIAIAVDVSAFPGWTQLDFFNQDQFLGSVTSGTPQFTLKSAAPGVYSFVVLGKNAQGTVATSQPVLAIVKVATAPIFAFTNPAGKIELTSPVADGVISAPGAIQLNVATAANLNPITRVDFFEGLNLIGSVAAAPFSFVWSNVLAGTYQFTARSVDSANNTASSRPFRVTVTAPNNQPPTVALTSPIDGASSFYLTSIPFAANAADSDGKIVSVDFFVGTKLMGTATKAPYTFNWLNPPEGDYVCTARATDDANSSTTSAPVSIHIVPVGPPRSITLNTPANNAKFTPGSTIPLSAAISGGTSNLRLVTFFQGEVFLGFANAAPFTLNWTGVPAGNYVLTAEVSDRVTGVGRSAPVVISVVAPNVNADPNVFLTSPADGSIYDSPADVVLTANAQDSDGTVKQVNFFQGTTLIGTATSSPFSVVWKNPPPGNYTVTAQAMDDASATMTSAPIDVIITPPFNSPPSVAITTPASNATIPKLSPVSLAVNASDPNGIARVDFFVGNLLIGSVSSPPFALAWTNSGAGTYVLNATVTDNLGASNTAAPVTITVNGTSPPNQPPAVALVAPTNSASFSAPTTILISANATDADGTIQRVDFFQGTNLLGSATQAPFSFVWANVPAGNYVLTAQATDNANGATTSAPITVNVAPPANQPPAVALVAPTNTAGFSAPATILISANATDADGTIQRVDFFQGASLLGSVAQAPFSFVWANVPAGNYVLTAQATDNANGVTTSAPITVNVTSPPNQPPAVALVAPTNTAGFSAPATILISANATDADGTINRVDLFQNNSLLVSLTAAPFTFSWTNVTAGSYALTATATDNLGASTTSLPVNIAVTPSLPPVLAVTRVSDSITLSWTGNAVLESADTIPGQWTVVSGVTGNSQTVTVTTGSKFYRLRQ